jgi:hypothetical protein
MENISEIKIPLKQKIIKLIKESLGAIIGTVIGGIGGFVYYRMVGCPSGACAITSNPWLTILWGATLGYLIGSTFNKKTKNT